MARFSSDSESEGDDFQASKLMMKSQRVYTPNETCERHLEEITKSYTALKLPPPPALGINRYYTVSPTYKNNNRLFDYQLDGLNWLISMWANGRSGILADEMGLGKTVQCISLLNHFYTKERMKGPFLVVAPLSTLEQWRRTAEEWTDMNVCVYYDDGGRAGRDVLRDYEWYHSYLDIRNAAPIADGSGTATQPIFVAEQEDQNDADTNSIPQKGSRVVRTGMFKFQILLTSYEILLQDQEIFAEVPFQYIIVDEAHRLKTSTAKTQQALRSIPCRASLLLSGTPLQNNTQELFALLHYMEPVRFCSKEAFTAEFGALTAAHVQKLHAILKPYLLRRTKEDVAHDLPNLEETIVDVEMTPVQKAYYRAVIEQNASVAKTATTTIGKSMVLATKTETDPYGNTIKSNNSTSNNSTVSSSTTKQVLTAMSNFELLLRKVCNHPFMIPDVEEREIELSSDNTNNNANNSNDSNARFNRLLACSGKFMLLEKLLPRLHAEGRKILIFSQFLSALTLLEEYFHYKGYYYERLDGSVKGIDRQAAIQRFNDPAHERFIFLLSTRAGGVGINLTSADTVIIFDSDWNPQNDVQATARAHRIGQTKQVKVFRLVTARSYESEMFERASRKLGLNTAVLQKGMFFEQNTTNAASSATSVSQPSKQEIERLLRHGAYGLVDSDAAEASKTFLESDIDSILEKNTRLVKYNMSGRGSNAFFSKTSFSPDVNSIVHHMDKSGNVSHHGHYMNEAQVTIGNIDFKDETEDVKAEIWDEIISESSISHKLKTQLENIKYLAGNSNQIKVSTADDGSIAALAAAAALISSHPPTSAGSSSDQIALSSADNALTSLQNAIKSSQIEKEKHHGDSLLSSKRKFMSEVNSCALSAPACSTSELKVIIDVLVEALCVDALESKEKNEIEKVLGLVRTSLDKVTAYESQGGRKMQNSLQVNSQYNKSGSNNDQDKELFNRNRKRSAFVLAMEESNLINQYNAINNNNIAFNDNDNNNNTNNNTINLDQFDDMDADSVSNLNSGGVLDLHARAVASALERGERGNNLESWVLGGPDKVHALPLIAPKKKRRGRPPTNPDHPYFTGVDEDDEDEFGMPRKRPRTSFPSAKAKAKVRKVTHHSHYSQMPRGMTNVGGLSNIHHGSLGGLPSLLGQVPPPLLSGMIQPPPGMNDDLGGGAPTGPDGLNSLSASSGISHELSGMGGSGIPGLSHAGLIPGLGAAPPAFMMSGPGGGMLHHQHHHHHSHGGGMPPMNLMHLGMTPSPPNSQVGSVPQGMSNQGGPPQSSPQW